MYALSDEAFDVLWRADGRTRRGALLSRKPRRETVVKELIEPWSQRVVRLMSG
ncbi:hypothetical protein WME94_43665 [Sorangium sp. So ce429]